jgi:hypothetical protein
MMELFIVQFFCMPERERNDWDCRRPKQFHSLAFCPSKGQKENAAKRGRIPFEF